MPNRWRADIWPRIRFCLAATAGAVTMGLMAIVFFGVMGPLRRWWPGGIYWWGCKFIRVLRFYCGAKVVTRISPNVDLARPYVFVSNHQSYLDIAAVMTTIPIWWRFLSMQQLRRVPLLGKAMEDLGNIFIDRGDTQRAYESVEEAARRIRSGESVMVYPEGGLSPDGEIQPFKRGGFALAIRTGVPIVPVLMRGSREVLNVAERRSRPGTIHVDLLDPIPLTDWTDEQDAQALADAVREHMIEAKRKLEEA